MKTNKLLINLSNALLLSAGLVCISAGSAAAGPSENTSISQAKRSSEARARMSGQQEEQIDASATLRKSTELYQSIVKGPHGQVPESVLTKAQCIAVLPDVMTGAVMIGGTHGVGITSCRENNKWSAPAFVKLNAVSFGAQLGGKSSDIILFILDQQAKAALKKGNLVLGADVSVVAGTFDKSFDTSTYGAVAYTRAEGAFAGASLSGGNLSSDDSDTTAYYGKEVNYVSLLEGSVSTRQNDQIDRFTSLLPR